MLFTLYTSALVFLAEGAPGAVGWDLRSLWMQMGWPARIVVIIMFIMSAWSVGIMIDRALMFGAARKQSRIFVDDHLNCACTTGTCANPATRAETLSHDWTDGFLHADSHVTVGRLKRTCS